MSVMIVMKRVYCIATAGNGNGFGILGRMFMLVRYVEAERRRLQLSCQLWRVLDKKFKNEVYLSNASFSCQH